MDNASDNFGLGDINKGEEILKKPSTGGGPTRKRLMDISNLQNQQSNPANQDAKQQSAKVATEEYVDKLHKENTILMQLLADRNKLLELSRVEILKLRTNLEKVQQQNLQLAQANSHMLREVNSGKDRLLVIQHELACKSGFLKAMKLEAEEKVKRVTCQNAANEEVANKYGEAGESTQAAKVNKPGIANRRQQSKAQSLDPLTIKAIHVEEMVGNKRHCSRRQSARFKSEEQEANEDSFKMDDAKLAVSSIVNAKQTVENKKRCLRRQSARFKYEELEANEDSFKMDNAKLAVSPKETVDNKKRQSARFKPEEPGVNEDSFKMDDANFANSPSCSRRQCAGFKSEETEANEDSFHMDDPKFAVSPRYDDSLHGVGPSLLGSAVIKEDGGETAPIPVTQEFRRSSVGRPSRRAAEKVTSYKEIPINVKMRRME
ncbi:SHUGOSHIN 2 isoform X3 [Ziziphus jujuba]|uniref:SHUGOSHIN 2 isoform X3 n=1 Tax=Ziziphus jujuba TaxID=326968 RepID=A0ABM3IEX8_ZIZJJ|nr:SHUGOSHIN 2 isoform X3 [Ziziphus jujuba]